MLHHPFAKSFKLVFKKDDHSKYNKEIHYLALRDQQERTAPAPVPA